MDVNDKIAANLGLVYQQLARFNLTNNQDAESFAYEALYRAVITFKEDAGNAFSTYAVCVIANELRKYLRTVNKKRQLEVISYYETIRTDSKELYLVDTIKSAEDTESLVLFEELSETVREAFIKVLLKMSDTQRKVVTLWYKTGCEMTQCEIANVLNVAQPTVSRAISIFKYKLKTELEDYV